MSDPELPERGDWVTWIGRHGKILGRVLHYRGRVHLLGECMQIRSPTLGKYIVKVDHITGRIRSVDELAPLLQSDDPALRQDALMALADLRGDSTGP